MLSEEAAAEPGKWRTDRAPYQRGMMDAATEPGVKEIWVMKSGQVGWTEILLNIIGRFIHLEPCPMLMVQPAISPIGQPISKERIAPMLRDTPVLAARCAEAKSRNSSNTILHKTFPGGQLSITGANSSAGLAARPIRILLLDEVDKFPPSAGTEGDPIQLAKKRQQTFSNSLLVAGSTPGDEGTSQVAAGFERSDQRYHFIPCEECGAFQILEFENIKWNTDKDGTHDPNSARYKCCECSALLTDQQIKRMVRRGEWRATRPFNGIAGFYIWQAYSPWSTMAEIVAEFLDSKANPNDLKVFTTHVLGQVWKEGGRQVSKHTIAKRAEDYEGTPEGVLCLTAGVDVQDNRIEMEVLGWGLGFESWSIAIKRFYGDPAQPEVWEEQLDDSLLSVWEGAGGAHKIAAVVIDSGHHSQAVYQFAGPRFNRRVYAIKGYGGVRPLIGRASRNNFMKCRVFPVGVDQAKEILFNQLRIEEPGSGYCHFPISYPEEYYEQLTAEKRVTRAQHGRPYFSWIKKKAHAANEALDLRVYNIIAVNMLNPSLQRIQQRAKLRDKGARGEVQRRRRRRPGSWMSM